MAVWWRCWPWREWQRCWWRRSGQRAYQSGGLTLDGSGAEMCLAVLYLTLYAVLSSYPKNNNVTPVLPFTALAAAVLVERLWQRVDRRLPVPWQPWLYAVAVAAVVLGPAVRAHRYAYRQGVPTTVVVVESGPVDDLPRVGAPGAAEIGAGVAPTGRRLAAMGAGR